MEFKKDKLKRRKKMAGISLHEMEEVAINFNSDIGNVIELEAWAATVLD